MGRHKKKFVAAALLVPAVALGIGIFNNVGHRANDAALKSITKGQPALYVAEEVTPSPTPTPQPSPDMEPGGGSGTGG
ncbi:MAG TPA: hypothetical protein VGD69_06385 [Herpetosiphonaceae bacterium]